MLTRERFKTAVLALVALYVLIFVVRSIYDLVTYDDPTVGESFFYSGLKDDSRMINNVASLRKEYAGDSGIEILDQKYERIASISAKTVSYDADLAKLDAAAEQSQAVVQAENAQGLEGSRILSRVIDKIFICKNRTGNRLEGSRILSRVIGVKPRYFDSCLAHIREIGITVSSTSQKIDKTYEYRQMLAQKQEFEKRLESYTALRNRGGSINEMLSLEDKIIEVESQLLQQSVDLGEYSDDNALCTINVSLYEGNPTGIARKIWNAFVWTNKCYFGILGGVLVICLTAVISVKTYIFLGSVFTADKRNRSSNVNDNGKK